MYAVIQTGGKQYKVSKGQSINVETLPAAVGETVEIDDVLLVADDGEVVLGTPNVEGAKVRATVVEQGRGPKIVVFKFKSGNRYHRKQGHRQGYTRLRIEEILREVAEKRRPKRVKAEEPEVTPVQEAVEEVPASVEELGLPTRVVSALERAGIETVEHLLEKEDEELLAIRGFGAKSLQQVHAALKDKGLTRG